MRILIVNESERRGGAAIAANRLCKALQHAEAEVAMLVREKQSSDPNVIRLPDKWPYLWRYYAEKALFALIEKDKSYRFNFSDNGFGQVPGTQYFSSADVIHFHWINKGFLHLKSLDRLIKSSRPIVITLHDMWYFTGGCHYTEGCERYMTGCGHCPMLKRPSLRDVSASMAEFKKVIFAGSDNVRIVACSHWLAEEAMKSPVFANRRVVVIPNPIDTTLFSPADKAASRAKLGLKNEGFYLGFVSANLKDKRKGMEGFMKAIHFLQQSNPALAEKSTVLMIGKPPDEPIAFPVKVVWSGYLESEELMALWYNAMDVFISASSQDNLPNTIMEAMSCGTPCIAYDIGGIRDMIDNTENGYLIPYGETDLMAGRIAEMALSAAESMRVSAREKVLKFFDQPAVAAQYLEVYNALLAGK